MLGLKSCHFSNEKRRDGHPSWRLRFFHDGSLILFSDRLDFGKKALAGFENQSGLIRYG
jgi:hypothetical protein